MKIYRYCNALLAGIVSGTCIDYAFQISGWEAAISIVVISIILCASRVYSDLEEEKKNNENENNRKKVQEETVGFREEILQKLESDSVELKTLIAEKSTEQMDRVIHKLQELSSDISSGQNEIIKEMGALAEINRSVSEEIKHEYSLAGSKTQGEIRDGIDRLIKHEESMVKVKKEMEEEILNSISDMWKNIVEDKVGKRMELDKQLCGDLQNELKAARDDMKKEVHSACRDIIDKSKFALGKIEAEMKGMGKSIENCKVETSKIEQEKIEKMEEFKKEICEILEGLEESTNKLEPEIRNCSDAIRDMNNTLGEQKNSLEDLKRETVKVGKKIDEKADNIVSKEGLLLNKYDELQKEYIKNMVVFSENAESVLQLLKDTYNHLNEILYTR